MIRLIFLNNPKDPMTNFVMKEIQKLSLPNVKYIDIRKYDKTIKKFNLSYNHTLIFQFDGVEVGRLEGPFDSMDLLRKFENIKFLVAGPDFSGEEL